jgi:hypothetical protein
MTDERNNLDPELQRIQRLLETAAADGVDQDVLRARNRLLGFMHSPVAVRSRRGGPGLLVAFAILVPAVAAALLVASILGVFKPTAFTPAPAAPTPSVGQTPTAPQEALLVIAQRSTGNAGNVTLGAAPDTVLITKMDGSVVAKATFKPAERPRYANAATILPPQVQAAAGAAFYIDGDGVVRRLDRDGTVTRVASFVTTEPQHMTSFAVSPDGAKLLASVFTFGAPTGQELPGPLTVGPSATHLEYADAGGQTRVVSSGALPNTIGNFMVVGWDRQGPIAGTAIALATQAVISEGWDSPLYHVDMRGNTLDRIGGSDCVVGLLAEGGAMLCVGDTVHGPAQVRTRLGDVLYTLPSGSLPYDSAAISPAGDRVAIQSVGPPTAKNHIDGRGYIAGIPSDFYSVGWADGQTLFGYSGDINHPKLAMIDMSGGQPAPARNFPINGFYIGVILAQDRNPTEGPYATVAAAQGYIRDRGADGPLTSDPTWSATGTLHVLHAYRLGTADSPGDYYFFFVGGYPVGQLFFEQGQGSSVVDDTTFMISYLAAAANDPHCCLSGGRVSVRIRWDGSRLVSLDHIRGAYQCFGSACDVYPFGSSKANPPEPPAVVSPQPQPSALRFNSRGRVERSLV